MQEIQIHLKDLLIDEVRTFQVPDDVIDAAIKLKMEYHFQPKNMRDFLMWVKIG